MTADALRQEMGSQWISLDYYADNHEVLYQKGDSCIRALVAAPALQEALGQDLWGAKGNTGHTHLHTDTITYQVIRASNYRVFGIATAFFVLGACCLAMGLAKSNAPMVRGAAVAGGGGALGMGVCLRGRKVWVYNHQRVEPKPESASGVS